MTKAEKKRAQKILRDLWHLSRLSEEKRLRLARLMDSATRATSSFEAERISGTGERSRLESIMVRKIDLEQQYSDSLIQLDAQRLRIERAINAIQNAELQRVLGLRYFDRLEWRAIMWEMHYSAKTSFRRHEDALAAFLREYDALEK